MKAPSHSGSRIGLLVMLATIVVVATLPFSESRLDGQSRLVAIEPLPEMDPALCEMPSGTALTPSLFELAALRHPQGLAGGAESRNDPRAGDSAKRTPLRTINDRYALYSAVAVDTTRNEVVLLDPNKFRVLVYDRTVITPANAEMTQPKRVISGPLTHLEFNNGVYVDSKTGYIYAVNNDTEDHLTVFDREKQGNTAPTWKLHTPHGTFGVAVDEAREEMYLTSQHSNAISVFPKNAKNDEPPIRLLQGDKTLLGDPHGIVFDPKTDMIFVANYGATATPSYDSGPGYGGKSGYVRYNRTRFDPATKPFWPLDVGQMIPGSGRTMGPSITVYRRDANGDVAPVRVIKGPRTRLNWPAGMAIDVERGEIYVANDGDSSVLVFRTSAEGDAAPVRVLQGPKTLLRYPNGVFVDKVNDELWVANFGNHTATAYKLNAGGDTAPVRVIRSAPLGTPAPLLVNARIGYDTKREEILAPN
jgi:DNA-binding beta-propeller fold protein YncE